MWSLMVCVLGSSASCLSFPGYTSFDQCYRAGDIATYMTVNVKYNCVPDWQAMQKENLTDFFDFQKKQEKDSQ